ncbi:ankyrin repeat-containing protein, partial [Chrysochromulina tobinii]
MSDSMGKAVWDAAKAGKEAELGRLIGLGGNVNWHNPDYYGLTALIWASSYGREGCVRLLLEAKAIEVNAKNNYDQTALHYAAHDGYLAIAKRLLEGGADVTLRDKYGETAIDLARKQGKSEVVALLSEPRYAARMHTDCPALPSGCAEAPSWA